MKKPALLAQAGTSLPMEVSKSKLLHSPRVSICQEPGWSPGTRGLVGAGSHHCRSSRCPKEAQHLSSQMQRQKIPRRHQSAQLAPLGTQGISSSPAAPGGCAALGCAHPRRGRKEMAQGTKVLHQNHRDFSCALLHVEGCSESRTAPAQHCQGWDFHPEMSLSAPG